MNVKFIYTLEVYTPKHLVCKVGESREISEEDAKILASQGYGYIESEGPPVKLTPHTEDNETKSVRKVKKLKPQEVNSDSD